MLFGMDVLVCISNELATLTYVDRYPTLPTYRRNSETTFPLSLLPDIVLLDMTEWLDVLLRLPPKDLREFKICAFV